LDSCRTAAGDGVGDAGRVETTLDCITGARLRRSGHLHLIPVRPTKIHDAEKQQHQYRRQQAELNGGAAPIIPQNVVRKKTQR